MITLVTLDGILFSPIAASHAATSLARTIRRPLASPLMVVKPITSIAAAKRVITKFLASFPSALQKIVTYKYIVSQNLVSIGTAMIRLNPIVTYKYKPAFDLLRTYGTVIRTPRIVNAYTRLVNKMLISPMFTIPIGVGYKFEKFINVTLYGIKTTSIALQKIVTCKYNKAAFDLIKVRVSTISSPYINTTQVRLIVKNLVTVLNSMRIATTSSHYNYLTTINTFLIKTTSIKLEKLVSYKSTIIHDLFKLRGMGMYLPRIVNSAVGKAVERKLSSPLLTKVIGTAKIVIPKWNASLVGQIITVVETTTQTIIEFWS